MRIKKKILTLKYEKIIKGFEGYQDDRRIASNIYDMLLTTCDDMQGINNPLIKIAVRERIKDEEKQIDRIIEKFTGKSYNEESLKWENNNE